MEAAVAAITADFASHGIREPAASGSRRGRGRRIAGPPASSRTMIAGSSSSPSSGLPAAGVSSEQQSSQQSHERLLTPRAASGRGRSRRGGGGGRGGAHGARHPGGSTSASDAEQTVALEYPAPATQVTTPARGGHGKPRQPQQQRYRSQLSETVLDGPPTSSTSMAQSGGSSSGTDLRHKHILPSQEELANMTYRERLTVQLNTSSIECPICYNTIQRKQPIASCQTCSAPYHLKCLRDWAERSIETVKEKAALQQPGVQVKASWRCPSCQSQYAETETPRSYWCFCGRLKDPKASALGNAHSCEQPCGRQRPEGCQHLCPLPCHAAPCDPCNVLLRMQCHCGKEQKSILCGTLHPASTASQKVDLDAFLSCGQTCNKMLACGLHACGRACHQGDCGDCAIVRDKLCYCGQETRREACGGPGQAEKRAECFGTESLAELKHWQGEYGCGRPCLRPYDCGLHNENELEQRTCHVHDTPALTHCPRSPDIVTTCPCGKSSLVDLPFAAQRESCQVPIPSCGQTCGKIRPDCGHQCSRICHEGPCGQCSEFVTLVCRCGSEKRTMLCHQLQERGEEELLCEKPCRALRNCGRHECGRKCCPLAFQEAHQKQKRRPLNAIEDEDPLGIHTCDRVCNRMLNCGQHRCQLPDHRGACQPCLRSSFEELTCHCGATTLMPPVPCSTRIVCNQPCNRDGPPCGHPKAPHTCHEDDEPCPPCPFLTTKTCQCHRHSEVKNVRCSQTNVSCGKTCDALLSCGYHRCKKLCHPAGECSECTQTCGKPRAYCGHPCQQRCHAPSKCPLDEPCPELVEATCPCGHIRQRTRCGASSHKTDSNGGVKLACSPACAVAQRNAALAEALGISKDRQAGASEVQWSLETIQYYGENLVWSKAIEQVFLDFVKSSKATHMFPAMKQPQRQFVHQVAEKFGLRSESLDEEPFRSVLVTRRADSAAPKPSLSEAWAQQYRLSRGSNPGTKRSLASPAATIAAAPVPMKQELNSLYLEACFGYDEQSLKEALAPSLSGMYFTLKWITDEDVLCIPKTSLPPSELTLKIRLIRNAVRSKLASCRAVDAAFYDSASEAVTHREKQWSSSASSTGPAGTPGGPVRNAWQAVTSATGLPPRDLSALRSPRPASASVPGGTAKMSRQTSPKRAAGGSSTAEVLGNGYHQPPTAVVVSGQPATQAEIADNWEDTVEGA